MVWTYARYSTDHQSVESQVAALLEYCETHRLTIGRAYVDDAKSGTTTAGREQFLDMIAALEGDPNPRPAGLVLWDSARFSRDIADAQFYKMGLIRRGYLIHFIADPIPQGKEGLLVGFVRDWSNQAEAEKRKLDAQRGQRARTALGFAPGGFPLRGYKKGEATIIGRKANGEPRHGIRWVTDPELEHLARKAIEMRLRGASYLEIHRATHLLKTIGSYSTWFASPTIRGAVRCGELVIENAHEPYCTKEQWDKIQSFRRVIKRSANGNPRHPRRDHSPFVLSGILFCHCGAAMVGDYSSKDHAFYRCGRRQREGREQCSQPRISARSLERQLAEWIAANIVTFERLRQMRDQINALLSGDQSELKARRLHLVKEQTRVDREARRLVDALKRGLLIAEIEKEIAECQSEQNKITQDLGEVELLLSQRERGRIEATDDQLMLVSARMADELSKNSEDARAVVRSAVVRAELKTAELVVHYVPPLFGGISGVPPRELHTNPTPFWFSLAEVAILPLKRHFRGQPIPLSR